MSLWPTLLFTNLSLSSRKITVSHQPFSVLTDFNNFLPSTFTHNFYPQYFHRFPQIFTDLHRFILPFSLYFFSHFLLGTQSPRSSQIFHRSFKDLSKFSFLHPFLLGTWTVGHSGPLSSFPQIFTDLHRFILPFSLYLSIIYSVLCLQDLHRSSTDLSKIFQKFPFLHPLSLGPGQSVIPAHSSDLQAFRFPPFLTCISWLILHRSSKILPPLSPSTSYLDSRSFRPTLQIFVISISYTLLSGQSVILTIFPRWRIHTKFPTRLP